MIHPAIVVVAFNRPHSLRRLLDSITSADYAGYSNVNLVVSIDPGGHPEVADVASSTPWKHGEKRVIVHQRHLGLRNHIVACGDLSAEYGAVIVLEDDLAVSRAFYDYAVQSVQHYHEAERVGGISLYSYEFNEYADMRFIPVDDGYDNYFVQTPSSWGQMWTEGQWAKFRQWYERNNTWGARASGPLPLRVEKWPESSWKKYFAKYMVETAVYFVYPRTTLTTVFGDDGTHTRGMGNLLQVPLLMKRKNFRFSRLEDSSAVYDVFFEPTGETVKRFCPEFEPYQVECDFYGTKHLDHVKSEYLLSSKAASDALKRYGNEMVPPLSNIVYGVQGSFYSFAKKERFTPLSGWRRLKMIYSQQRVLSGLTALALGSYRILCLLRTMLPYRPGPKERRF